MVIAHSEKFRHGVLCCFRVASAEDMFRRFGEEKDTKTKNYGPEESNAHGYAPRGGILDALCAIVDNIREEDTNSNE